MRRARDAPFGSSRPLAPLGWRSRGQSLRPLTFSVFTWHRLSAPGCQAARGGYACNCSPAYPPFDPAIRVATALARIRDEWAVTQNAFRRTGSSRRDSGNSKPPPVETRQTKAYPHPFARFPTRHRDNGPASPTWLAITTDVATDHDQRDASSRLLQLELSKTSTRAIGAYPCGELPHCTDELRGSRRHSPLWFVTCESPGAYCSHGNNS